MKNHRNILLWLILLPCMELMAGWNSFVLNFDKGLYGKGAQTWQIATFDEQWTFFANKNGLVSFDGNTWELLPMNNMSDVRSVLVSNDRKRIYVGGINEFGYFEPGSDGVLHYHCMSDTLDGSVRYLGNVWGVHEVDNILYFQGDGRVVKCLDGQYTSIFVDAKIDCSNVIDGVLYIGTDKGVWILVGNTFFPLQGADELVGKRIRGVVPYGEGVLVVTAYDGLYYIEGRTIRPFQTGAEEFLRRNEVFCCAVSGQKIALGTIHKGLLIIDGNSSELKYYNENNGLHNNTVLSVAFDKSGNLWAGLDSGIDYVCLGSPFTNLYVYPYSYGTGYAAAVEGNRLYLGTNRGLYYTTFPVKMDGNVPDIRPVEHSSGQVWNLSRIGDELFCMHDRGLFLVEETSVRQIPGLSGVWNCQLVMGRTDMMFAGVYDGIYLLQKEKGDWKVVGRIADLNDSCRLFEQESDRVLWIYNVDCVTRITLDISLQKVEKTKKYYLEGEVSDSRSVYVSKVEDRICFATPHGIYYYNSQKDALKPADDMNALLNGSTVYSRLWEYNDKLITLSPYEICVASLGMYKRGSNTSVTAIQQSLMELVPMAEALVPLSDSLMILPNEKGFALLTVPPVRSRLDRTHYLHIKNMYLSYPKDSLVYTHNYLGSKPQPEIAYSLNSVRFEYALPTFWVNDDVRFQYRLNDDAWSDYTTVTTKEYSDLLEGDYTFEVKAIFKDGTTSLDAISFTILPPWYRNSLAFFFYFTFVLLAAWEIYRWDNLRVQRKKQLAMAEKDKELQAMEQEYEEEKARQEKKIVQLEKERLEFDLQHKSQEMANLMINFVRKNEMLTEIKQEIARVATLLKGEGSRDSKQQLILINSKIDANIQSDEVLKRIEEQFDLIHNNFMKRLTAKHPDLSNNERMMCAYLKMNLSTKEIAPLLNISVRGVETIRYRLRKKFALERDESLLEYLDNRL